MVIYILLIKTGSLIELVPHHSEISGMNNPLVPLYHPLSDGINCRARTISQARCGMIVNLAEGLAFLETENILWLEPYGSARP
jgi:hypothetical protein